MNHLEPAVVQQTGNNSDLKEKKIVFFPNLDGLRFLCFVSVFFFHAFSTDDKSIIKNGLYHFIKKDLFGEGNLGVNFFFVLSGFLITYLLIVEKENFGKINIASFYVRRILRIWPLFYFCVFFGFVIFPYIKHLFGEPSTETAQWPYYLFFLNNIDYLRNFSDCSVLAVLWSVAIEEQFYLIWPLLLQFLPVRHYLKIFTVIIIISWIYRYVVFDNYFKTEYHTLACISDMTVGGVLATLINYQPRFKDWVTNWSKRYIFCLYVLVAVLYFFRTPIFYINNLTLPFEKLVISIIFGMVILEQNYARNSFFKMSKFKIISKLGRYTYGLYCLHMISLLVVATLLKKAGLNKNVFEVIFLEGGLSLLLSIGMAYVSYHYYESWFLRFKNKFSRISKY